MQTAGCIAGISTTFGAAVGVGASRLGPRGPGLCSPELQRLVYGATVVIDRVQGALPHRCSRRLMGFSSRPVVLLQLVLLDSDLSISHLYGAGNC